jgi:hypothetical protein
MSAGFSGPTHEARHALSPHVILAPWHAWPPTPHCMSQGPAFEQVTIVF